MMWYQSGLSIATNATLYPEFFKEKIGEAHFKVDWDEVDWGADEQYFIWYNRGGKWRLI